MTKAIKAVRKVQRAFKAALHAGLFLKRSGWFVGYIEGDPFGNPQTDPAKVMGFVHLECRLRQLGVV